MQTWDIRFFRAATASVVLLLGGIALNTLGETETATPFVLVGILVGLTVAIMAVIGPRQKTQPSLEQ